jgi:hypothetical protein
MIAAVERNYPEEIHPALWRASQLARGGGKFIETGFVGGVPGWRLAGRVID